MACSTPPHLSPGPCFWGKGLWGAMEAGDTPLGRTPESLRWCLPGSPTRATHGKGGFPTHRPTQPFSSSTRHRLAPLRRPSHLQTRAMRGSWELLLAWFLVLAAGDAEHVYRPSRRVCSVGPARGAISESFVQRVYQPYLTLCDGHRACSTYRTIYRAAYRRSPGPAADRARYVCCPGWKRIRGLPGACGAAICQPPCGNGGLCTRPGRCHCPEGWQGDTCQTDVDECSTGGASCPQHCVNTAGSYWCRCWEGYSPSADGRHCLPEKGPSWVAPSPTTGADGAVREEVHRLQTRVDMLEQVTARNCSWCWPPCTAWPLGRPSTARRTPAACWRTPSSSWSASTL